MILWFENGRIVELKIVNSQVDSLKYDADGDGIPETVIPPTRVITNPQTADLQAPQISVSWNRPSRATWVTVNLTDNGSGVRRMFFRNCISGPCTTETFQVLNQSTYITPLSTFTRGIEVVSEDNDGNRSNVMAYTRP